MSGECDKCGEHCLDCKCPIILERKWVSKEEAKEMFPASIGDPIHFDENAKIYCEVDENTGEVLGEPYSFKDWLDRIKNISGVNEELMGKSYEI